MKKTVCDKCNKEINELSNEPYITVLTYNIDHENYHLCKECYDDLVRWITKA